MLISGTVTTGFPFTMHLLRSQFLCSVKQKSKWTTLFQSCFFPNRAHGPPNATTTKCFFVSLRVMLSYVGVSKNNGTPKWMVYNGKPYEQMDDLGVPLFLETPMLSLHKFTTSTVNQT